MLTRIRLFFRRWRAGAVELQAREAYDQRPSPITAYAWNHAADRRRRLDREWRS